MNLNPFKKEEYSLEKVNNTKERLDKVKELAQKADFSHPSDLGQAIPYNRNQSILLWRNIVKTEQGRFDKQFELGRSEASEINKEYDRITDNIINSFSDMIEFRIEKLGQTKEEAIKSLSFLFEKITNEINKDQK